MQRFVALYDLHVGFERRKVGGEAKLVPTHCKPAIAAALEFVKDFEPDTLVLGGDQLNFAPISHWNKGKLWANEGGRIKREMDTLRGLVLDRVQDVPERIWMDGNHEAWLDQFIDENPAVEGLLEPENYLDLDGSGWSHVEQGGIVELGKLGLIHGDNIRGSDPARSAMTMYGRNVRLGHHHTYKSYTHYNPVDARDVKTAIAVPGMCERNPTYGNRAPNSWLKGFLFGYVWPDGRFSDYVVVMTDNSFVAPGSNKLYRGKDLLK